MGIKGLSQYLKNNHPELFETVHISEYSFQQVAIDLTLYLCNFKVVYGEERWLEAFINMVACLRKNEVHCVFSYDSGHPPEKEAEKKRRTEEREKREKQLYKLEESVEDYHNTGEISVFLQEFYDKKVGQKKSLLRAGTNQFDIKQVEFHLNKMRKQLFHISEQDFALTKEIFGILDVPFYDAPLEAETMCADLCVRKKVEAVLSEDTDVLAYGSPVFLTKFSVYDETVCRVHYKDVLEKFDLTSDQFLDFCIMCGTDYNKNIPRVGPATAYKLLTKHGDIDTIDKNTKYDVSILKHKRGRELFREYKQKNIEKVPYCGIPDFDKLKDFIVKHRLFGVKICKICPRQAEYAIPEEEKTPTHCEKCKGKNMIKLIGSLFDHHMGRLYAAFVHNTVVFVESSDED